MLHLSNIAFIFVTFKVLKLLKSNDVNLLQLVNIEFIFFTFVVLLK